MKAIWKIIINQLAAPKFEGDREKTAASNLLNALILIRLGNTALFTITSWIVAPAQVGINLANVTLIIFLLIARHLMKTGRIRLAAHLLLVNLYIGTNATVYGLGSGVELPTFVMLLILIVLAAGLLLGPKVLVVYAIAAIVSILGISYLKLLGLMPPPQPLAPLELVIPTILLFIEVSVMLLIAILGIRNSLRLAEQELREREKAEMEVRSLNEALEQRVAERTAELQVANKDLEAFTYSVSHDLRAPLRAIDGFTAVIVEENAKKMTPDEVRYHENVRISVDKMQQMITGLLAFSRSTRMPIGKNTVYPEKIIRQVFETLKSEQENLSIEIHCGALPACQADLKLLTHVYSNLLRNAVKFSAVRETPIIACGSQIDKGEVVYFVRDNGVGFDMQYAERLFQVFQRLHSEDEFTGTGVGLAIVERIITRHGGRIWAEGALDVGATFYFTLGTN